MRYQIFIKLATPTTTWQHCPDLRVDQKGKIVGEIEFINGETKKLNPKGTFKIWGLDNGIDEEVTQECFYL